MTQNMIIPSLSEVAIVLLSFGIVGIYLLIVRQFLKNSDGPSCDPSRKRSRGKLEAGLNPESIPTRTPGPRR
jgi:hypothetical protein